MRLPKDAVDDDAANDGAFDAGMLWIQGVYGYLLTLV